MKSEIRRPVLKRNDYHQAFVFNLLFKVDQDFSVMDDAWTEAWNVVRKQLPLVATLDAVKRF